MILKRTIFSIFAVILFFCFLEGIFRIYESASGRRSFNFLKTEVFDNAEKRTDQDTFDIYIYGASTVWGEPMPEVGLVSQMQFL